jgi:DNA polymerase-3 subunit gamma/tau
MSDTESPSEPPRQGASLAAASGTGGSYRVLARKYRPATFEDLIGQDAMVRTITNAFETGRIPQAWILTGVRGVGKTTTARILARALNYQLPDNSVPGPTVKMPRLGLHCQAIMESRHIDVLELDAASHNSVEDVRQINDAVRYAPVSARYKVYILDEVHMLSGAAFNALLKTLEEPPPHAKFIFATTEIRKVPVTVLSRCQRFDLRRVETGVLVSHLQRIAASEKISAEPEALSFIARAAEGSVRDALSLFDQAVAHAAGTVRAETVRQMLGMADRARIIDLFEALMRGDMPRALQELRDQYDSGADPATVLADLADFVHFVTRVKIVPSVADDISLSEVERTRGRAFAAALSMRVLARAWQMLLKGLAEVQNAARPIAAVEMVLVRLAYVADLPTPDEALRALDQNGAAAHAGAVAVAHSASSSTVAVRPEPPRGATRAYAGNAAASVARALGDPAPEPEPEAPAPALSIENFEGLVALASQQRDLPIKTALERDVRLVRFEDGRLEIALEPGASKTLVNDLQRKLSQWTNRRWMVIVSSEPGQPTLKAQAAARQAALENSVRNDPLINSVLERFPGARIVSVRPVREVPVPSDSPPEPDPIFSPEPDDDTDR